MTIGRETTGNYSNADTDWKKLQASDKRESNWRELANCIEEDPEMFSVERGVSEETIKAAKAVCRKCVARVGCLNDAVETGEKDTIRGGYTPKQRAKLPAVKRGVAVTAKDIKEHDAYIYAQYRARNRQQST